MTPKSIQTFGRCCLRLSAEIAHLHPGFHPGQTHMLLDSCLGCVCVWVGGADGGDLAIVAFHILMTKHAYISKVSHSFDVSCSASRCPAPKDRSASPSRGCRWNKSSPGRKARRPVPFGKPSPPRPFSTPPTGVNAPLLNTFCVGLIPLCCRRLFAAPCFAEALDSH